MAKKPPRKKHIPQRTCVACRLKIDKRRLTRIVRTMEGNVVVDPSGKLNGRGAYLCDKRRCWNTALDGQVLDRALSTKVSEEERKFLSAFMPAESG